jgi:hypothetical protein
MACREHSCTRRALLGAVVALPVVGVERTAPLPPTALGGGPLPLPLRGEGFLGEWRLALDALARAEGVLAGVEGESAGLAFDAAQAGQAGYDAACAEWEEAVRGAMVARAPDWRALALKVVWRWMRMWGRSTAGRRAWRRSGGMRCGWAGRWVRSSLLSRHSRGSGKPASSWSFGRVREGGVKEEAGPPLSRG